MKRVIAIALVVTSAVACSNPRALRFTETNENDVLARVEKSSMPEDEKALLRAYVARAVMARAASGFLAALAGNKAAVPTPPQLLAGKTVGDAINEERKLQQQEKAEKDKAEQAAAEKRRQRDAYLPKLELRGIRFREGGRNVISPEKLVFVEGEVRNGGDRTLSRVEVTAYLLDSEGHPVAESTCHPVLSGGLTRGTPLRPNYVAPLLCLLKSPPKEWAERVDAKITDITFEEADKTP